MAKKIITGWIGRTYKISDVEMGIKTCFEIIGLHFKKSKKKKYLHGNWPPRKVRITVEEVD